jgi:hypothetical protein
VVEEVSVETVGAGDEQCGGSVGQREEAGGRE